MSDREIILSTLAQVQRRLQLSRTLYAGTAVFAMIGVGALLWRALVIFAGHPPLVALAILAALMFWVAALFLLGRRMLEGRCTLAAAAGVADDRAELQDELKTAYWFADQRIDSPWVVEQQARAARTARALDLRTLLPVRVDVRTGGAALAAATLIALSWFTPPLVASPDAEASADTQNDADARQLQQLRQLIGQTGNEAVDDKLQQAVRALERKDAAAEEKQRALSTAQRALEQQNLQAASAREGLYRLSEKLRGNKALEKVAEALREGDAEKAAMLTKGFADRNAEAHSNAGGADGKPGEKEKDLESLLKEAASSDGSHTDEGGAAAKEAVDRLNQIAQQLDVQARVKEAANALQNAQLRVAQRSVQSAGRFSQQAAQNSTPSPDTGQTNMPGGVMFRAAAVAKESKPSQQQEGSKTGAAMGDAQADPVLGDKVAALAVQLKREGVESDPQAENGSAPQGWYYTQSQEQRSVLEMQQARARSGYAVGTSAAPEGISIRHRQIVRDYFMNLREGSPQ